MKTNQFAFITAALLLASSQALALPNSRVKEIKHALNSVPVPELPAKAVEIIKAADAPDQHDVALATVRAVTAKNRTAAPVVISAISKAFPGLSLAVTKAAVAEAPEQKRVIENAAHAARISSAPSAGSGSVASPTALTHAAPAAQANSRALNTPPVPESEVRGSANHGGSHGTIVVHPGPIKYKRPLPDPPRRPVDPPVRKGHQQRTR